VSTLTKGMFVLTKSMGHERHMIFLVSYFDQVLNRTFNQKGQFLNMVHQHAHGLVKSAILNGHV
jgi:hypothetical protein